MKRIFVAIMALGALVSCSKDELVSQNREVIGFGSAFVDNSTRATSTTDPSYYTNGTNGYTQLTSFNVYGTVGGVNIFDNVAISKGDNAYGSAWTQAAGTNVQYWIPGANYVFDAVVDATSVTKDVANGTGLPTSLLYEVKTQKDMLYNRQTVTSATANQGVVTFAFTHLLSKVKFSVQNTSAANASNYRFNLTEIKLTGVYDKASYKVSTGSWDYTGTAGDYALDALIVNSASTQYNAKEVLLIPGSNVGVSIKGYIQTKTTVDGQETWKNLSTVEKIFNNVLGTDVKLTANKAYHFAVTLGIGNEIKFTATEMTGWVEPTDANGGNITLN